VLQIPETARPRLLAALERRAADRYDAWAASAVSAAEAEGLRACAAREREIAAKADLAYPASADEERRHAELVAEAAVVYLAAFEHRSRAESFELQAALERAGAAAWRGFADADVVQRPLLLECAALEEASAAFLDERAAG
jgi:hypothetical protein